MLYYESNSNDPRYNQALEELLLAKETDEILMLWQNEPAVVVGCCQNLFAEVDVFRARKKGITLVRRTSGGGAVYHDRGNFNFTLIRRSDAASPLAYADFLAPVIEALALLGIEARQNRICDLTVNGKKISGSAQRCVKGRVLHHGTLLYDTDLSVLRSLTAGRRAYYTAKGVASSPFPVTNLKEEYGLSWSTEEFFTRLREALFSVLSPEPAAVSPALAAEAEALARDKYADPAWTYGRCPSYRYKRPLPDGTVVSYEGSRGKMTGFEPAFLLSFLEGSPLNPDFVYAMLHVKGMDALCPYIF